MPTNIRLPEDVLSTETWPDLLAADGNTQPSPPVSLRRHSRIDASCRVIGSSSGVPVLVCGTCTTPRAKSTLSQRSVNFSPRRIRSTSKPRKSSGSPGPHHRLAASTSLNGSNGLSNVLQIGFEQVRRYGEFLDPSLQKRRP